jgi:hypothetical protein
MIILMLVLLAPHLSFAHNLNITDYDTTVSGGKQTEFTGSYFGRSEHYIDTLGTGDFVDYRDGEIGLSFSHDAFYDSLNNSWDYGISDYYNNSNNYWSVYVPEVNSMTENTATAYYDNSVYFSPENNLYHGISCQYSFMTDYESDYSNSSRSTTDLSYNVGVGHVINITPLAEAGVMEDRLMEANALKARLAKEDMLKLAEIINRYRMGQYGYENFDTGKGHFLEDITKVLRDSGQLNGDLNGFGFWRISDYRQVNYSRYKGWKLQAGLKFEGTQSVLDMDVPASDYNIYAKNGFLEVRFTGYHPIDWQSQLYVDAYYDSAINPDWQTLNGKTHLYVQYSYDLTNNLWWQVSASGNWYSYYSQFPWDVSGYLTSNTVFSAGLNYKIEDFTRISLNYSRQIYEKSNTYDSVTLSQTIYL